MQVCGGKNRHTIKEKRLRKKTQTNSVFCNGGTVGSEEKARGGITKGSESENREVLVIQHGVAGHLSLDSAHHGEHPGLAFLRPVRLGTEETCVRVVTTQPDSGERVTTHLQFPGPPCLDGCPACTGRSG